MHHFEWYKLQNQLAKKELQKIKRDLERKTTKTNLPQLPREPLQWIQEARPIVEGKERSFLTTPFWEKIYEDDYPYKMIVGGRQTRKSTYLTDTLALEATSNSGAQVCYIAPDEENRKAFFNQKLRIGTFSQNPTLSKYPRNKLGNASEISLRNGSTIYGITDNQEYRHIEGKSPTLTVLDEAQYQDIQYISKLVQAMMSTKGKLTIVGIGGESGSPYEELWNASNQNVWVYNNPNWRDELEFGLREDGTRGLIEDEYLIDVLAGKWVPQKPENNLCHGYHVPQTIFPTIPLTIDDAITKYNVHPEYSIEYRQKKSSNLVFKTHTMGEFHRSARRPITPEMVLACMNPYKYLGLFSPMEIGEWKDAMGERIMVSMGVDFGSGNPSNTVISIVMHWLESDTYHLAFIDKRPAENQLDQTEYINRIFKVARCDVGVGDLGYGAIQVKSIQEGGVNRLTGTPYYGVGSDVFFGCNTIQNETKPIQFHDKKVDAHGEESSRITIDKTTVIQRFINVLDAYKVHPLRPEENSLKRPQLIIPYLTEREFETEWLIKDFTSLTRKDLQKKEFVDYDPRQEARKEFNHPKDSLMSIIYALVGLHHGDRKWFWVSA